MDKNVSWNYWKKLLPLNAGTACEDPKVTSALLKKLTEDNNIGPHSHLLETENFNFSQENAPDNEDFSMNRNSASHPESALNKSSPIKIMRGNAKIPCYENIPEPVTNSPLTPDLQSNSFRKSVAYQAIKFLNLSGDGNDGLETKNYGIAYHAVNRQDCNASAGTISYSPSAELSKTACSDYIPGDDSKLQSHHNFVRNFWDTRIASPGLAYPIKTTNSDAEERICRKPVRTLDNGHSSRPFPTTLPVHHENQELQSYVTAGATVSPEIHYNEHFDFDILDDQGPKNCNTTPTQDNDAQFLSPEYFLQHLKPRSSTNTPLGDQPPHKTDIVTLMQELALTYGGRFCEETTSVNDVQYGLMANSSHGYCVFCRKNNAHATFYRSHTLKRKRKRKESQARRKS
ncbi:uncharacterized protein LOC135221903 isoform X2 [Macrobrachium nipponense]|uniref:uncharacterized protein LOC135221903 isoform X2 n=1 Tax=Macrobrachium nipponense TaxID=159736 RepID=UPI0030C7AF48